MAGSGAIETPPLRGGCLCGAVRWSSTGPILWAGICHCESCRRANSAPMVPFFGVPRAGLSVTGPMRCYASSDGVERMSCATCASPLFYQNEIWPDESHVMAATLDDLSLFQPQAHFHWAERARWIASQDNLPKYPGSAETSGPIEE